MVDGSVTMVESPSPYRFSVQEYNRMGEAGILGKDERVELIRGEVIVMTPIGIRHAGCLKQLIRIFARLGDRAVLSAQDPVQFEDSEPQPDFALLRARSDSYWKGHPGSADVLLIVEVSDSSQRYDREVKGPLYAENGLPEYWLVDLVAERIEVYRRPENGEYREALTLTRGDRIAPEAFPDFEVAVGDVLP